MPHHRALYDPHQAIPEASEPRPAAPLSVVTEPASPEYHIAPAWIDTAGRTRTWALREPHGTQMAEITTKSAAQKLAQLLNNIIGDERGPTR